MLYAYDEGMGNRMTRTVIATGRILACAATTLQGRVSKAFLARLKGPYFTRFAPNEGCVVLGEWVGRGYLTPWRFTLSDEGCRQVYQLGHFNCLGVSRYIWCSRAVGKLPERPGAVLGSALNPWTTVG